MGGRLVSKKISRLVSHFKRELANRDATGLLKALQDEPSKELLTCLREQKVLYCVAETPMRECIAAAMRDAARTALAPSDQQLYGNYIQFALATIQTYDRLTARATALLSEFPKLSLDEVLQLAGKALELGAANLFKTDLPEIEPGTALPDSVAAHERAMHARNGLLNDLLFAIARSVNEISRNIATKQTHGAGAAVRAAASVKLNEIVWVASQWNALEFVVDNVAFGEFQVTAFEESPQWSICLDYVEPRRVLLRQLSIRRSLVSIYFGNRRKRVVREALSAQLRPILEEAISYFEALTRQTDIPTAELLRCETQARRMLLPLDAEDDLLCAASKTPQKILLYYVVAATLHWFTAAAELVRKHSPARFHRALTVPTVKEEAIVALFGRSPDEQETVRQVLDQLAISLPVRRHFDMTKRPFIRDGARRMRMFCNTGEWNVAIRELLIQGGELGKDLGRIWEDFIKETFVTRGWDCIGQGVRARDRGRVATDIDLLLVRDGLLLVAQVKAVTGSGSTPYDHWKTRQTIEFGCHQARVAVRMLTADPQRLVSLSDRRTAERIQHIEPVVLTNADTMDGVVCDGVTVLATTSINSITEGARVDYRQESGRIVDTRELVAKKDLTRQTILWILRHPIETRITTEQGRSEHIVHQMEGIEWKVPVLSATGGSLDLTDPDTASTASEEEPKSVS
jgi:hypothetical protein